MDIFNTTSTEMIPSLGDGNDSTGLLNPLDQSSKLHEMLKRIRRENVLSNLALAMVFSLIVLVSLFGNSLVVYVIVRNKRMHTVTNAFITNLAVADLLITCLNIPFNIIRFILNDWLFGNVMCHVINYVQTISVYAFTFTLVSIALDRYRVIMFPLRPRISMCLAVCLILLIWLLSALLSIPFGLYYGEKKIYFLNSTRCTKIFPSVDIERFIYLATTIAQYIIPLLIITLSYGHIAHHLWSRTTLGHVTRDQQLIHMKSKKKTIKMLVTVVLAFAVLWLPLNIYYLVIHFPPPGVAVKPSGKTVFSCYWAAMFSVSVNPFIYSWFNDSFRLEVLNRFSCCFRKKRKIHPGYEMDGVLIRSDQVRTRTSRWRSESGVRSAVRNEQNIPVLEITPPPEDFGMNGALTDLDLDPDLDLAEEQDNGIQGEVRL